MLKETAIKRLESSSVVIENAVLNNLTVPEILKLIKLSETAQVNIRVSPQVNLNVINL